MSEVKTRRPRARSYEVIVGAIMERLAILEDGRPELQAHAARLRELLEELNRARNFQF